MRAKVHVERRAAFWCVRFSNARLDGSQYCLTDGPGKIDRGKVVRRVQIIISRLIDHAELPMPRGVGIGKHLIDLSGLQRNLVALVLQAGNKLLGRCFHGKSVDIALDLELPAPNTISLVPVYLREPSSAIRKSDTGNTLSFSPVTAPIEFAQSPNFSNGRTDSKGLGVGALVQRIRMAFTARLSAPRRARRPLATGLHPHWLG